MQGFVKLVDVMGDDTSIVQAARISYGDGTKTPSDDRTLIRYLMRHRHTTPFEMVEFKFHVRCPMDVWRQWIRHRTANVNEYSTRYSEAIDECAKAESWRAQSGTNKQGSSGEVDSWPEGWVYDVATYYYPQSPEIVSPIDYYIKYELRNEKGELLDRRDKPFTPQDYLSSREEEIQEFTRNVYEERLKFGVAREQARKDLPLSNFTEAYWKIDLHNLLHFLSLRLNPHAQLEIREFAEAIADIVKERVPWTWEAFVDYRLEAVTLSRLDIVAMRTNQDVFSNKRERSEFLAKAKILGFEPDDLK